MITPIVLFIEQVKHDVKSNNFERHTCWGCSWDDREHLKNCDVPFYCKHCDHWFAEGVQIGAEYGVRAEAVR